MKLFARLDGRGQLENFTAVLLRLGWSYVQRRQLDYGRGCYEWALLLSIGAGSSEPQLAATRHLCRLYERESPDPGRCIRYNQHQVQLLRTARASKQEAESLEVLSQRYLSLGTERCVNVSLSKTGAPGLGKLS